tara:strand:+ start:861 stop:2987 length:2127 start_codon:yes stop_codon:yes gene_type:complete
LKILVTGGTGFIGKNLLKRLYLTDHKILVCSRNFKKKKLNIEFVKYNVGDLLKKKIKIFKPEVIIHLAWEGIPNFSKKTCQINLQKNISFFNQILKLKSIKKIISSGSCAEYGDKKNNCLESFICKPNSYFSDAKIKTLDHLKKLSNKNNIEYVWLRLFFVYGPLQRNNSLIPSIINNYLQNKKIKIKNPLARNDYIFVGDVIDAILKSLKRKKINGIINIGSGKLTSTHQVLRFIEKDLNISNLASYKLNKIEKKNDNFSKKADISRAKKLLGWYPKYNIKQGIIETLKILNNMRIKQAVFFCGGVGKRLLPLTKTIPKPMTLIDDMPFLWHLLKQFSDQGINNFLLLTGYKSKIIKNYFKNGSKWKWKIKYHEGPINWKTGKRLFESKKLLNDYFFLNYSDNFMNFDFNKMKNSHKKEKKAISLSVVKKKFGNIYLDNKKNLIVYNNKRGNPKFNFVEIGYMLVDKKKIFKYLNKNNINFSDYFNTIIRDHNMNYNFSDFNYLSISDLIRLSITKKFFKQKKVIFVDRDGIINKKKPKGQYVSKWKEFEFIKENLKGLYLLCKSGFKFILITNQAGVERKLISPKALNLIHNKMLLYLKRKKIDILKIYCCPHHWDTDCYCRKPKPGLFFEASRKYNVFLKKTLYIGDDPRDCEAAFNSGSNSILIQKKNLYFKNKSYRPLKIEKNILDAIPYVNKFYSEILNANY